ncbi:MAG: hypothetical protein AAF914_00260 [Pseudomonadota bacterium]
MDSARRLLAFFGLMAFAALAAAIFGALHNQLSFSVGPDYFRTFKFIQFAEFGVAAMPERVAVSVIGALASWWMGLIIGFPAFLYGLVVISDTRAYLAAGLGAVGTVMIVVLACAVAGLAVAMVMGDHPLFGFIGSPAAAERLDFIRAGLMHTSSYFAGGALGLITGVLVVRRAAKLARTETRHAGT